MKVHALQADMQQAHSPDPISDIHAAIARGNLQFAEFLCRQQFEEDASRPEIWQALAHIASQVGAHAVAAECWHAVRQLSPGDPYVLSALQSAHAAQQKADSAATALTSPRYLLIKAWGYGFWSDLDHVLTMLLVADITGRIPIVHWGRNSLFLNQDSEEAFSQFFEPVSPARLSDLQVNGLSFYPNKWSSHNLLQEDLEKWHGLGSRCSGLYLLGRQEDVVVSDFHTKVHDLLPWIPVNSPYAGLTRSQIYRALVLKYLRLKPHLAVQIEKHWSEQMQGRHWLAVHIRGTDKVREINDLHAINEAYYSAVDQILAVNPSLFIFLLTDSKPILERFQERYRDRIFTMDVIRSDTPIGVHYAGHSGKIVGDQVIVDSWLASRCQFFLGNGGSNVSVGIRHLKDWAKSTFFLIGDDFLGKPNILVHTW
jgi:protein O-GlcNAc transferase